MKKLTYYLISSFLLFVLACQNSTDWTSTELSSVPVPVAIRSPQNDFPPLSADFSRGLGINNAGALVGSAKNSSGQVVAFKLSNQGLWLSDEVVMPNGLPEARFSVNDRGDVAGHKAVTGGILPVCWHNGVVQD
ncbi:MAG TPA: hypothetical protein VJ508_19335, partial [Saprospiraceae bacterium]|nr:hypothetical protein [Saprospiraceae bacterium]